MVNQYINQLLLELATGNALEHSYRPALKALFESIDSTIKAVNEPSRSAYGAPDFAFYKQKDASLSLGYVETKDITVNLDTIEKSEQLKRYLGYANLILTNYLEFRFFRNGEKYHTIRIARLDHSVIVPIEENYGLLLREIKTFLESTPETITNAPRLAKIMGGKAARIRDNVVSYLKLAPPQGNDHLLRIYKIMQELLVHDLTNEKFADMYAQTLVYGLFVARYYDETPENFTRQEARDLIPASNPFLQQFFDHITGANFDKRLAYIVDELCDVFAVSAVHEIIAKHYNLFGEVVDKDPIIHFYEDFLKEYDHGLRKKMGAYYTPVAVVNFIIRAVDDILKNEFSLSQGLADTSKIERQVIQQGTKAKEVLHKVQILDPAVGTATFLNEIIKFIFQKFKGQEGVWKNYVEKELLSRLYGFELMMAPYTIAHLKLAMTLKETGIDHFEKRLGVYLTNTLEEGIKTQDTLFGIGFGESIAEESRQAAEIKSNKPIMIILGNPPYSGISSNETNYANNLINKYKVEPGGRIKLKERKHWLNDDYVKFIGFAEKMISETGEGILAMITNNGYIDNPTFRGMRWHLAKTFDKIYVYDLHGNVNKHEVAPGGGKDENVFDIMQGVGIVLAIKTDKKNKGELGEIYHADLYGSRKYKFDELSATPKWQKLKLDSKMVYFVPKNTQGQDEYEKGFSVEELFLHSVTGIVTMGDNFIINESKEVIAERVQKLARGEYTELQLNQEFGLGKNYAKFVIDNHTKIQFDSSKLVRINYRPFDNLWTYFDNRVIWRWRENVMRHLIGHQNISLVIPRQAITNNYSHVQVSRFIVDAREQYSNKGIPLQIPLYLYHEDGTKTSNLRREVVSEIEKRIGKTLPEDIFDYIYAVLHSQAYREKYKEFLKIDFPRVPYPRDKNSFNALVELGGRLRKLHLMEDPDIESLITTYSVVGENMVEKVEYSADKVFINDSQYFGNVSKEAWNFYVGGYQPAQKWLKDRKGRRLTYDDIIYYQKIVKVLIQTEQLMIKIDGINFFL